MKTKTPLAPRWILNALLIAVLLAGFATTATEVRAGSVSPASGAASPLYQEDTIPDSDYWTLEKMRNAIPYDVLPGSASTQTVPSGPVQQAVGAAGWKPSRGPDGVTLPVVSGRAGTYPAPTPTNAYVSGYVPASNIHTFPYSANGKVYFVMGGRNYVCSASVIGENTIWTAGHCVSNGRGTFHSNWVYVPVFDNYTSTYPGPWLASYYVAPIEFTRDTDLTYDYAIVGVRPPAAANGRSIRSYTGALGFAWNMPRAQKWKLLGYPQLIFDGVHMVYSDSTYWADNPRFTPASVGVGSNLKSGASGGPWILNFSLGKAGQVNYLNGTNSYISSIADELYSSYLDERAKQLWDCSQGAAPALDWSCFDSSASGNLTLSYTPSSDPATGGAPFTYQIDIHNPGSAAATGVVLKDSAALISADLPGGVCNIAGSTATCTLATLPAGATASATLTVSAPVPVSGSVTNIASVTFDQQEKWDVQVTFDTAISCSKQITVTNTNDSGAGSLREALANVCSSGAVIDFDPSLSGGAIHLVSQLEIYGTDLTIDGSALPERLTLSGDTDGDGAGDVRVLYAGISTLTLDSLIITKGLASGYEGGGISANGLTLINSEVTDSSSGYGGGIKASVLTLLNSTIAGNSAQYGGGMYVSGAGAQATLTNSTLSGNSASADGGGIYLSGATSLLVVNSTLSGNNAGANGGGIYTVDGTSTLINSTLSGNSAAGDGAGIYNNAGTLDYANTIIDNGSATAWDCLNDGGTIGTNNHNLVGDGSCADGGVSFITGNPKLGPLADNGGPTRTQALLTGSPALDAGDDAVCTVSPVDGQDQRGVTRPIGKGCDIGAFEDDPIPTVSVNNGSPSNGAVVTSGTSSLKVVFSKDMLHDGSLNAADNPANYLLVEAGENDVFDTQSCHDGLVADDAQIAVDSVSYVPSSYTAILLINGGEHLPDGQYRLFVCGTTSIMDLNGLKLNAGRSDARIDFMVALALETLPATGFAPERVTALPPQTVSYADLGDLWLEIPRLGVKMAIVGIPRSANGEWDVSWLGQDAGWLNGSAFPTWAGNSVLTGHVWNADNTPGPFAGLNQLWWGDEVVIHAWGGEYVYAVRSVQQVSPGNVAAMMKHEELPWLTLVTCRGYDEISDSYKYRVLVRAVLVEDK